MRSREGKAIFPAELGRDVPVLCMQSLYKSTTHLMLFCSIFPSKCLMALPVMGEQNTPQGNQPKLSITVQVQFLDMDAVLGISVPVQPAAESYSSVLFKGDTASWWEPEDAALQTGANRHRLGLGQACPGLSMPGTTTDLDNSTRSSPALAELHWHPLSPARLENESLPYNWADNSITKNTFHALKCSKPPKNPPKHTKTQTNKF